jgi:hypothetical protein
VVIFEKSGSQSKKGWDAKTQTQTLATGDTTEVTLRRNDEGGDWAAAASSFMSLQVAVVGIWGSISDDCTIHELPRVDSFHRRFVITALGQGTVELQAGRRLGQSGADVVASMKVEVTGSKRKPSLVFFPGERSITYSSGYRKGVQATVGMIYVVGGNGERFSAAGGPKDPFKDPTQGGHTGEPTPRGRYVLGRMEHVTTTTWPSSVIPWGAVLRINPQGEVEFKGDQGGWRLATGPRGEVTQAEIAYQRKTPNPDPTSWIIKNVRDSFIDRTTNKLKATVWEKNDFGKWGWNLKAMPGLRPTAYYIHTVPLDEKNDAAKIAVQLNNSHGCIHIVPSQRAHMVALGYLKEGIEFEVRPYSETGPP